MVLLVKKCETFYVFQIQSVELGFMSSHFQISAINQVQKTWMKNEITLNLLDASHKFNQLDSWTCLDPCNNLCWGLWLRFFTFSICPYLSIKTTMRFPSQIASDDFFKLSINGSTTFSFYIQDITLDLIYHHSYSLNNLEYKWMKCIANISFMI